MKQNLKNILAKSSCIAGLLFCVGSLHADERTAPKYKADASTFKCITQMTSVKHFFVDNLAGNLAGTVEIAKAGKGQFPEGTVLQLIPNEVMVKQQKGFSPKTNDYGGYVNRAQKLIATTVAIPAGYTWRWAGEYEFQTRAKQRLKIIVPIVFFVIFLLLYMVFKSAIEAAVLIFPTLYAMSGGLLLQWVMGYNFSVAVWVGYIALFGIAVETGVVMVVYLHEAYAERLAKGALRSEADLEQAVIDGAVQRLRPKLMTVTAVILSLAPILWETGIGSDVMRPIAAPIVGGMITSTIHVLILVPVFFLLIRRRAER